MPCVPLKPNARTRRFVLEKDIWVVATLGVLFDAPFGHQLVFKGGTSLSKVWRAIRRFSEDIDITYEIRGFAPDLVAGAGDEALPLTRSQERPSPQAPGGGRTNTVGGTALGGRSVRSSTRPSWRNSRAEGMEHQSSSERSTARSTLALRSPVPLCIYETERRARRDDVYEMAS